MNETLKLSLQRICKKIDKSSGYSYLYSYFDDIVKQLKEWSVSNPNDADNNALVVTIKKYKSECVYCKYNSPGWFKYASRCFYCADYLVQFISDKILRYSLEEELSSTFDMLVDSESISFFDDAVFNKYCLKNHNGLSEKDYLIRAIKKAIYTASQHHPLKADVEHMAYSGSKFAYAKILQFIDKYRDYSYLKEWIPALSTPYLADVWFRFPDRYIYDPYRHRHMVETIERYLDDSLELHLKLWELWYNHNREEILDIVDSHTLIEVLEVCDDEPFKKLLKEIVQFPANDKVIAILEHFTNDDEAWIVNLSKKLLMGYTKG